MIRKFFLFLGMFALSLTIGCASTNSGKQHSDYQRITMPAPGKSKVVFVRPEQYVGRIINFTVHDGREPIGVLFNGTFIQYECAPGSHLFSSSMEDIAFLDANLLPDHIYYAKLASTMGTWISQVNMYSLYPGCPGKMWEKLPDILKESKEATLPPGFEKKEAKKAAGYWERVEKNHPIYQKDPRREQILPEHGLTAPIQ